MVSGHLLLARLISILKTYAQVVTYSWQDINDARAQVLRNIIIMHYRLICGTKKTPSLYNLSLRLKYTT